MPHTLPLDLADFPAFRTRKALLVIDLQNEFLSSSGTLPVSTPDGFVDRTLDVARKFRESGSGDIFWIRSQFDSHRPAATSHIITSATTQLPRTSGPKSSSVRHRTGSEPPSSDQDADPEAFLSVGPTRSQKQTGQTQQDQILLAGSHGSELAPPVASSVNARQDMILVKTHYSAFNSTQLLNRLRTRFVTELYVCGALTNISIYATALDAARHGLSLTIIEDCCGYRDITRHDDTITSLIQLTGCETLSAEDVIQTMAAQSPEKASAANNFAATIAAITAASGGPPRARRLTKTAVTGLTAASGGSSSAIGGISGGLPVRTRIPEPSETDQERSREIPSSPSLSPSPLPLQNQTQITIKSHEIPALSHSPSAAENLANDEPETTQSLQPVVATGMSTATGHDPTTTATSPGIAADCRTSTSTDPAANEAIVIVTSAASRAAKPSSLAPAILPKASDGQTSTSIESRKTNSGQITPNEDADEDDDADVLLHLTSARHAKLMGHSRLRSKHNAQSLRSRLEDLAKENAATGVKQDLTRPISETVAPMATMVRSRSISAANLIAPLNTEKNTNQSTPRPETSPYLRDAAAVTTSKSKDRPRSQPEPSRKDETPREAHVPTLFKRSPLPTPAFCSGDTVIHHNVLPESLEKGIYERLRDELQWQCMSHQGGQVPRLMCVQGYVGEDGSVPVYRHPSDECIQVEKFAPTVGQIKLEVEKIVGHPLNHVLIQYYRSGNDYISEHSDKTLDIVPGSYVCNMSLGAERTMVFRTKRAHKDLTRETIRSGTGKTVPASESGDKRQIYRAQLPHNSLCCMGLQTNMQWLHAIRQDKRASRDKSPATLAYGGGRISLTFRRIGTFLDASQTLIWGQGAVAKSRENARPVVNGQTDETVQLLRAFGSENHSSVFDWEAHYGRGFDVLHMSISPRFFASTDAVVNMTIQLYLAELGIKYAKGSISSAPVAEKKTKSAANTDNVLVATKTTSSLDVPVRFMDNDKARSAVEGVLAILLYLNTVYGTQPNGRSAQHHSEQARKFTRLQQVLLLQDKWRAASVSASTSETATKDSVSALDIQQLQDEVALWESYASETRKVGGAGGVEAGGVEAGGVEAGGVEAGGVEAGALYIAGGSDPSFVDCALWSVLHSMETAAGSQDALLSELQRFGADHLAKYYAALKTRSCVREVVAAVGE